MSKRERPPDERKARRGAAGLNKGDSTTYYTRRKDTTPARAWAVITTKWNGARIVFGTYESRDAAARVVVQLQRIHCQAEVAPARAEDSPGAERRKR